MPEPINVIEVRKAANGYVVSAFMGHRHMDHVAGHGYATYVVESNDPRKVGEAVAKAIEAHAITEEVVIPPARGLP